jgi:NADH-quinone oxidoreductase subunit L
LGTLTLLVARLSALIEVDAKKVVALSTLRQLGLIFMALALGLPIICFFHIAIHALAKANLFMVIGRLLHRRFSQQDARLVRSSTLSPFLVISISISLSSLIGLIFTAGFFSKEQILIGQSFLFSRFTSITLIISIAGLTLAYCFKLFLSSLNLNIQRSFQFSSTRIRQLLPIFFLRRMRMVGGFLLSYNLDLVSILMGRIEYIY